MATNERGYGRRVHVTAAANRASGDAVVEEDFHGIVPVTVLSGATYDLMIEQREYELAAVTSVVKGSLIYIDHTTGALTLTSTSNRLLGKATKIAGDRGCPTGKMHVLIAPNDTTGGT